MEATLSRIINWEIQNTAKLAEQIIQDKTKYKKRKLAETNGRKSDLVRRPLGQELNPKVSCESLGQVAHSVVSCRYQRLDPIIQPYWKTKRVNDDVANATIGRHHTRQRFGGV